MPEGLIEGFTRRPLTGDGVMIDALVGGSGPPLLLLHGYPQTRVMWRALAPALARQFTVVVPDLRGYGRSDKPPGDAAHELYSKRVMARDQIATMRALGFDRFAVAGHDRGGRVAYRLALDHPDAVRALVLLDILPTAEVWARASAERAMAMYHWYFLAQPQPLPETLIGGDPELFLRTVMRSWAGQGFIFEAASMVDYVACFRAPASIHASCEDYRAGWSVDRAHDEADRGVRKIAAPLLIVWSEEFSVARGEPLTTWSAWASSVEGHAVPGGHFVCEESAEQVLASMQRFLSGTSG
ncbi:MAG: alpha/beta hydrolase [Hyphomicrobium sp.]|nr:MAG: alpha/beta hydrolase [Hyphomicrobium sp.]